MALRQIYAALVASILEQNLLKQAFLLNAPREMNLYHATATVLVMRWMSLSKNVAINLYRIEFSHYSRSLFHIENMNIMIYMF